ncbi:uncharacterized protein PHALS_10963 [Plasmopara halstedii]|uniref:Uncharacterized protein n=1 Tax=Plasmopara halstedii TaxID=4781 RepID=A0A0P1AHY0_PLAHL|nr:uncharacterized protein PHALS_10963 [Plasmopara halstedii]CEG40780.1 hypothetical protein PHALS_10963 [Plasmopara halstedii]|eukprot:XP_024577149.1 hypothetical protein PHALS_10963 [Plasmopara halstedii]
MYLIQGNLSRPSFLHALIIPLKKKEDLKDAMDSNSQTGCTNGREVMKIEMKNLAISASAEAESGVAMEMSRVLLLLDFDSVYDTVS